MIQENLILKQVSSGIAPLSKHNIKILHEKGFIKGSIPTSCQNTASLWLIEQMNLLGKCICYCQQPQVMHVRIIPNCDSTSLSLSDLRIFPHTDVAWQEKPPKFIGFFCLDPGNKEEYQTISDSLKVIKSLPKNVLSVLTKDLVHFPSPKYVKTQGFSGKIIDNNNLRINYRNIRYAWSEESELFFQELINAEEILELRKGSFWFIDNKRYAHGRHKLSYDSPRHLLRCYGQ
ncbi:MAG: TauD/TfdA family dioxygenase [Cyanobacteria bacterium P01_G01_bin.39]